MKRISDFAILILVVAATFAFTPSVGAQQWHTTLDVLKPATKSFPQDIEDLLIVNNTISQPSDFGHALLFEGNSLGNQSIDLTEAPLRAIIAATRVFDYSEMFFSVGLVEKSESTGTFFAGNSLSRQQTDSLCRLYNADAVLSLDRVIIYDKQETFIGTDYDYHAYLEVFISTIWTLTTSSGSMQSLSRTDTLYWEGSSYDSSLAEQQLPDRQTALLDVAEYAAEQFAEQYINHWQTVDRYLYQNADSLIELGLKQFTYKRWEKAVALWTTAYNQNKSDERKGKRAKENSLYETKAYAAANIAVAEEVQGHLELAEQWAKRSADCFAKMSSAEARQQQVNVTYYMREIQQRQKDEKKLLGTAK